MLVVLVVESLKVEAADPHPSVEKRQLLSKTVSDVSNLA